MKKFTIELDEQEIEIVEALLNSGESIQPTIEDAILEGILEQILNQTKP